MDRRQSRVLQSTSSHSTSTAVWRVDRLLPRVSVLVEAAAVSVDSSFDSLNRQSSMDAALVSNGSVESGSAAATCVGVGGGGGGVDGRQARLPQPAEQSGRSAADRRPCGEWIGARRRCRCRWRWRRCEWMVLKLQQKTLPAFECSQLSADRQLLEHVAHAQGESWHTQPISWLKSGRYKYVTTGDWI